MGEKPVTRILIPSCGPSAWRQLLADPEKHWVRGASAFETAVSWEAARHSERGIPAPIVALLDTQEQLASATALIVLPEHKVKLEGRGKASQNDVWALLKTPGGYVSMSVEGKAGETFGDPLWDWLRDASPGKLARLQHLCKVLGAQHPPDHALRYQLFHRTASALIEAERFGAAHAVMIVQSFRSDPVSLTDYIAFGAALGATVSDGQLAKVPRTTGPTLYLGWVTCEPATDRQVASVV
ncbi:DUF6946 family protein [Luteimonas kalidii]|uniref:DUF6946 domain-containing protein n=1 Tax=Luteimonas kalidii TaxID=3042025 RepID=A0ABT6JXR7_9GAMM|nr:hypothetical protein [Luteimonas kalidii]MDH5835272.1 hypothetical protein [Luteimonas kalidii]